MRQFKFGLAVLMAVFLASCGGGNSDVPAKPRFSAQVSFGDSLSDVGSYKVGAVAALGGGQFTINAASGVPTNWTELTAAKFGLAAPCAAVTGGFGTARTPHPGCFGYAQGGARVTDPAGFGNVGAAGPMTEPVATQIAGHLAAIGNQFSGDEIVFVMAGANDVFVQAATVVDGPTQASAVAAMRTAANDLADAVNTQIIANGAKYVVVVNVPDIASTPYVTSLTEPDKSTTGGVLDLLVTSFNSRLKADLPDSAYVLNVDAYTASKDEVASPLKYNLSNVQVPACNIAVLPNQSALFCNSTTLNTSDTHYLFADAIHPTPYGHSLFALYVLQAMTNKGWY